MVRTKRKSCIKEKGKMDFCFDYEKELSIYCFIRGEKLSRKKWRKVEKEKRYNTYTEWKNYIETKYSRFSLNQLSEFSYYLQYLTKRNLAIPDFANPYISALLAALISYLFTYFAGSATETFLDVQEMPMKIIEFIIYCVVYFVCIKKLVYIFLENRIEESFCSDYKKVIDELLVVRKMKEEDKVDLAKVLQILNKMENSIIDLQETVKETNKGVTQVTNACEAVNKKVNARYHSKVNKKEMTFWNKLLEQLH